MTIYNKGKKPGAQENEGKEIHQNIGACYSDFPPSSLSVSSISTADCFYNKFLKIQYTLSLKRKKIFKGKTPFEVPMSLVAESIIKHNTLIMI